MNEPLVSIVLRSFNEAWALRETLPALRAQDYRNWELIVIDSGSTDGSVELIREFNPRSFQQIAPAEYMPGRVLNQGVQLARAEYVVCLNADATPQGPGWLRPLANALLERDVAAVFGRQTPRPDCQAVFACDYERCYGEPRESAQWDHFFSMANSGLRKDIWARRGFLEELRYSEDEEYTRWWRRQGYRIVYVPESVVMHSHNYSPAQAYQRSFGEATTTARLWAGDPRAFNWPSTVLLGWLNDLRRDFQFCRRTGRIAEFQQAARVRWQQRRGRLAGFRAGRNARLLKSNAMPSRESLSIGAAAG
jgi:rhamnosyltransferase